MTKRVDFQSSLSRDKGSGRGGVFKDIGCGAGVEIRMSRVSQATPVFEFEMTGNGNKTRRSMIHG
jgi:hypothetical protein